MSSPAPDPSVRPDPPRRGPGGFSLIEVLMALALLTLVLIAILPLFTRAIGLNASGREAGRQSQLGRAEVEELLQLPFNHDDLEVEAGTEKVNVEFWSTGDPRRLGDEGWRPDLPTGTGSLEQRETALWQRTTTVRQYGINGVQDTDGDGVIDRIVGLEDADRDGVFDDPLPAGSLAAGIHLKEMDIEISTRRQAGNIITPRPDLRLQQLKSF